MTERETQVYAAALIGNGAFRGALHAGATESSALAIGRAYCRFFTQVLSSDPSALNHVPDLYAYGMHRGERAVLDPNSVPRSKIIDDRQRSIVDLCDESPTVQRALERARHYVRQQVKQLDRGYRAVVEGLEQGGASVMVVVNSIAEMLGDDGEAVVESLLSDSSR